MKRTIYGLKAQLRWIKMAEQEIRYIRADLRGYSEADFNRYSRKWALQELKNINSGLRIAGKRGYN